MDDRDVFEAVMAVMMKECIEEDDSPDDIAAIESLAKAKSRSNLSRDELKDLSRQMKAERITRLKFNLIKHVYKDQWQAAGGALLPFDASKPDPGMTSGTVLS